MDSLLTTWMESCLVVKKYNRAKRMMSHTKGIETCFQDHLKAAHINIVCFHKGI